jgi:TolB-like protein/DNA-binding winged helix-turn-helix (wHTH) protein/Tfp pilus assembly protein PilF
MGTSIQPPRVYRFGGVELDTRTGELVRDGQKVWLHDQPLQLLLALLGHPGELLSREELTSRLWPDGTLVDFDRGLNKAVNKLRDALGDSADEPRFIETLPRRGYRFVGTIETEQTESEKPVGPAGAPVQEPGTSRGNRRLTSLIVGAVLVIAVSVAGTRIALNHDASVKSLKPGHLQIGAIAVLPLENLSGDPEQAYFVDGMTDALITEASRAGTMRVVSRTTILRYKGTRLTTKQIGRELGVDAIVEGTVLRSGNRVRITAQLIQVLTDNHLWAQSYERDLTEVLQLQRDVAEDIARHVGRVITTAEAIRTVNPMAYGEYLKGRFYFFQYTREGWQRAIEHFQRAIDADSSFAPARAGLAQTYIVAWGWNALPSEDGLRKGKAIAEEALQLDPDLASAHLALGSAYAQAMNHENAEKELRRALELNPNDPLAWQVHGIHQLWQGHFDEGIADQERAVNLDPFSPIINANLARAFCFARQYDRAIAQARKTLAIEPGYGVALVWLEHAYRHKGMLKEAYATRLTRTKAEELDAIEKAYGSGKYRGVLLLQAEADERTGDLGNAARAYAQAGNKERALALLEECYRRQLTGLGPIKVDADFDPIRPDLRFKRLLQQLGYEK